MNEVFQPYLRQFVLVFFDDILIYSKDFDSHLQHLKLVFQLLIQNLLVVNGKKCLFAKSKIDYFGSCYLVPTKLESMASWPVPTNIKSLRGI